MWTPDEYLWLNPSTDKVTLVRYARRWHRRQLLWAAWQLADQLGLGLLDHAPRVADRRRVRARVRWFGRRHLYLVERETPGVLTREQADPDAERRTPRSVPGRAWAAADIRSGATVEAEEQRRQLREHQRPEGAVWDARAVLKAAAGAGPSRWP